MRPTSYEGLLDVLVVDARPLSRRHLESAVAAAGHSVGGMADGELAVREVQHRRPGVVLVDVGLLGRDDWQLVGRFREACEPTIVVAHGPDEDGLKVRALDAGCDDYLVRTAPSAEIAARVRAALRLLRRLGDQRRDEVYDDGLVRIDAPLRQVEVEGVEVTLTPLEFRLLLALVRGRDRVVSREELLEATWHDAAPAHGDHVKLYVHYLRRKLSEHTAVDVIQTVRGFGYRWLGARAHERAGGAGRVPASPGAG